MSSERVSEIRQRWENDPTLASRDIRDLLAALEHAERALAQMRADWEMYLSEPHDVFTSLRTRLGEAERQRDAEHGYYVSAAEGRENMLARWTQAASDLEIARDALAHTERALAAAEQRGRQLATYVQRMVDYDHAKYCRGDVHCASCIEGRIALTPGALSAPPPGP